VISRGSASDRRERVGWYFYDFANSAFSTSVVTVFLGPYLTAVARAAADADGFVRPLGVRIAAGSFFPYVVSLSVLLQVVLLPVLGAAADYSRRKKPLLLGFAYLGSVATMGLYFLRGADYLLGGGLYLVANISFGASVVVYNAFLSEIATTDERDTVSSRGWALGYLGGGLLLGLNLVLVWQAATVGLTMEQAVRISLLSAGAWWAVFTLVPMATLQTRQPVRALPPGERLVFVGFKQARRILGTLRQHPHTLRFLVAHLLYNDGIQTVITLAAQFGREELGLTMSTLAGVVLMVQFVAVLGALLFDYVARVVGAKRAIVVSLVIWIGVVVYAYGVLGTAAQFFVMGAAIAIVLGGTQALSRSLYSVMIPRGREVEYFSVFEISERGASWMGPLLFGLALQFTGSYRIAILSVAIFLLSGLAVLALVDVRRAVGEADHEGPAGA
jgi:UMF1 family MFS transporter